MPTIFVDKAGVMRWSDSKAEASFYGANYTVPFAHAYRALSYKGINHKEAIDRDVYHLARLGFNAYRIHIWDVEISDGEGNLVENEHLDLLDYLFAKLQEKNMRILITTMTNFGNGYPERNQQTGAFSYMYDKCDIHANPQAVEAQKRYVSQLLCHVNPYTGYSYQEDPYVVGFEINNEPCHSVSPKVTENYIQSMLEAMKKAGNKKPVFYNVSHNKDHVSAYFNSNIQGTTYQWYPMGLVAGRTRQGNFLPHVDNYAIPFSDVKGFADKVKAVYEYDPADNLYSYIHPAMSRTFRSAGFQWITQFAYDPMDIAAYNTEYQTHYLNLAYTPAKAISMLIAAEVAYRIPRGKQFPGYPQDTVFGDFSVSYVQDLAVMNTAEKYYYSNETSVKPVSPEQLKQVAGHGSSPLIRYTGSGAYFLDRLEEGVWRLELMPDVEQVADPFAKPSLQREAMKIGYTVQHMDVRLPDLEQDFDVECVKGYVEKNPSEKTLFRVKPGVYLLRRTGLEAAQHWTADSDWNLGKLGEFYAPAASLFVEPVLTHVAAPVLEKGRTQRLHFRLLSDQQPDSLILQTDGISFWKDNNPYYKLVQMDRYGYTVDLPAHALESDLLRYTVTVFVAGKRFTFPDNRVGTPLDWDYEVEHYWSSKLVDIHAAIVLVEAGSEQVPFEHYAIPETAYLTAKRAQDNYSEMPTWNYSFHGIDSLTRFFWLKDIRSTLLHRPKGLQEVKELCLQLESGTGPLEIGFVTTQGYTYSKIVNPDSANATVLRISLDDLELKPTALLPAPYPAFLERYFQPKVSVPFRKEQIEKLLIATTEVAVEEMKFRIGGIWME
ncbi:hypothetical protein [Sphingobacterium sp. LRF_L2]|uniref:hypothetical protein n=1 Tax=Sphingobacterium sp. LRF_L2 TaxID=3369421 RepID=UPI003F5F0E43